MCPPFFGRILTLELADTLSLPSGDKFEAFPI
jgi:hypothetical protein